MKIPFPVRRPPRRRQTGSAVVVALTVLLIMSTLAVYNSQVLSALKQDLQQIERHQLKKYAPAPARPPAPPAALR